MSDDEIDINHDGKVDEMEHDVYEKRAKARRGMAWVSLCGMILSAFSLMFFVGEERLTKLDGLLELYWLALGSTLGAYVGISTWASKKG